MSMRVGKEECNVSCNMARKNKVTTRHSAEIAALYQKAGVSGVELMKIFPQYSRATIYRHARSSLNQQAEDGRKNNKGRPKKPSIKEKRQILWSIPKLRKTDGSFTSKRVVVEAGVQQKESNRTVRRVLNSNGYRYFRSRKKGLLYRKDLKERMKFCRKIRKLKLGQDFWNFHISFYLDGKGFQYKSNPVDQAKAPKSRGWRKKTEGLKTGCTAKGKKEGAINCNFMVGISYNRGVVLCEQYAGSINGEKMANIVRSSFPQAFEKSIDPRSKRFLQDGCPRQNSKTARDAFGSVHAKVFKIPSRSPDLNPIENFFNLVSLKLKQQALDRNIEKETFKEFAGRVKKTLLEYPIDDIDKIIDTMDKRIKLVLDTKGMRIKY